MRTEAPLPVVLGLAALLALSACAAYRPGEDGRLPILIQNQSSNAQPEPAGSLPRGF